MVNKLDNLDKRVSKLVHESRIGFLEFLVLPFAVINNPPGIVLLAVMVYSVICNVEYYNQVSTHTRLQKTVNYFFHVVCVLLTTTFLKKFFNRPRPRNPEKNEPNKRYVNLRGHEHNASMPSGDTT